MSETYSKITKQMVKLSYLAYTGILGNNYKIPLVIEAAIQEKCPDMEIAWGPFIHFPRTSIFSDELLFVLREKETKNYTVIIRGTNPFSFKTWREQDFNVSYLKSWNSIVTGLSVEDDPKKVSKGVFTSISIIREIRDQEEKNLFDFLIRKIRDKEIKQLYFTGHSLGGLMASTLALLLYDLYKMQYSRNITYDCKIQVHAFAALTAGNKEFASYSDSILKKCYCYYNPLDIISHCFIAEELEEIENLYSPNIKLMDMVLKIFFGKLKETVKTTNFAKLKNQIPIKSKVNSMFFELQMNYQHVVPYLQEILGEKAARSLLKTIGFGVSFMHTNLAFVKQSLKKIKQLALAKLPLHLYKNKK